jgi:fumarate hydratase class I
MPAAPVRESCTMTPPLDTAAAPARPESFRFTPMFPLGEDRTSYRKLDIGGVSTLEVAGRRVLTVRPETLEQLARAACKDVSHLLRPGHLQQLADILKDPEASANDRFVALDLLKNASIAAGGVLPMCQDTGTAIVFGKKGSRVWVEGDEEEALSFGVHRAYTETNLRYSQMAPLSMYEEVNTGNNLPVQFDIYAAPGEHHAEEFELMFVLKGGGSANKTFLFQQTRAVLNKTKLLAFLEEKVKTLGTSACPPYHLAVVIGGTSAETTLKTVKLASTRYLDQLPTEGSRDGHAFRDLALEAEVHKMTQKLGIGAQFGGKYFCHDVRVIRLPRHGASLPIGIGVSCSADRQIKAKITAEGVFLEQLEQDPAHYLPETTEDALHDDVVKIDLTRPMSEIRETLSRHPIRTRLSLTGPLVVARDIETAGNTSAASVPLALDRRAHAGVRTHEAALVLDVVRKFVGIVLDHGAHWHRCSIAEGTNRATLNAITHGQQSIEVIRTSFAVFDTMHHPIQVCIQQILTYLLLSITNQMILTH